MGQGSRETGRIGREKLHGNASPKTEMLLRMLVRRSVGTHGGHWAEGEQEAGNRGGGGVFSWR